MNIYTLPPMAKEIKQVLEELGIVRKIQVIIYEKKLHPEKTDTQIEALIEKMIKKDVFYEPIDGYLSYMPSIPKENNKVLDSVVFFWVYLAIMETSKIHFDRGRYPCDYVALKDNKVMEFILYFDNGPLKMNYLKHKRQEPNETVIVIVLLNQKEEEFEDKYRPHENHQIISLHINPTAPNDIPKINSSKLYKGTAYE